MSTAPVDSAQIPYRRTPEYLAAVERANRDRAGMRYRIGTLTERAADLGSRPSAASRADVRNIGRGTGSPAQ
jgi:hypothetical protein